MEYRELQAEELFARCALRDRDAWEEFMRRYHRKVSGWVVRALAAFSEGKRQEADEVVQEVYKRLCAKNCEALTRFSSRSEHSEFAYLKVITERIAHGWRRTHGFGENALVPIEAGLETCDRRGANSMERQVLLAEVDRALEEVADERDRMVFRLYFKVGLTAKAIATHQSLALQESGVEGVIGRVVKALQRKFKLRPDKARVPEGKPAATTFL